MTRTLGILGQVLLLVLAGCGTTATVGQAGRVADAGIAYADSMPALFDESFRLAATADSLTLAENRGLLTAEERGTDLAIHDELLTERLKLLRDLKAHALVLRSYFVALKALAETDVSGEVAQATRSLAERLGKLHAPIATATIGGQPVGDLIDPVVNVAVAAYQNIALRRELDARAGAIERELALQKAAIQAIGEQMLADWDLQIQIQERNPLFMTFIEDRPLPDNWTERRIAALIRVARFEPLNTAEKAIENLHQSWIAFAEGRLGDGGLALLLRDIEDLVQLAVKLKGNA